MPNHKQPLQDYKMPIKVKLAALWTSLMFCYIYCDYFGLYERGKVLEMNDGIMGPLGVTTPQIMLGVSIMMAIPSLMIFCTLALKPIISRILNIVFGIAYTLIMIATFIGASLFYQFFATIEIIITLYIAYSALKWPRETQI
jgi:hypothetical protein